LIAILLEPGLKPVPGLFGWNRLQLLLAELGAILQNLIRRGTWILIHKVTRRRASCNPSKPVADMTSMMQSSVATRVTTMPARVATAMSSPARKYQRRTEDKDNADD
jgi:hypothetical protein